MYKLYVDRKLVATFEDGYLDIALVCANYFSIAATERNVVIRLVDDDGEMYYGAITR